MSCAFLAARDSKDFDKNILHYYEGATAADPEDSYDGAIQMNSFLPEAQFDVLLKNLCAGLIPKRIVAYLNLSLDNATMTYGWEPDGSGKKWANRDEANRHIPVEKVSFEYDLREVEIEDQTDQLVTISTHAHGETAQRLAVLSERVGKVEAYAKSAAEMLKILVMAALGAIVLWLFKYR